MELEMLNATGENLYHSVMMMVLQSITLILGLVSLLFILFCLLSAACACLREMTRPLRRQVKPVPKLDTQKPQGSTVYQWHRLTMFTCEPPERDTPGGCGRATLHP